MPFTFSHPAAIVPFRLLPKQWTSLTGLVIGSMAPDFEYFIRMRGYGTYGHTWFGLIWFCIPVAITLAFIYHYIVRDAFLDNLPEFLRRRTVSFKNFNWKGYFKEHYWIVIISIVIGACTHVIWDGFTHKHGLFVKKNGWFDQAFIIGGYIMPRYKMLQHSSTVVGGLFILYALLRLPVHEKIIYPKSISPYWITVVFTMITVFAVRMLIASDHDKRSFNVIIVTLVAGWLIGMVVAGLFQRRVKSPEIRTEQ